MGPVIVRILFLIIHSFQPIAPAAHAIEPIDPWQMMISNGCLPQPQMNCHLQKGRGSDIFYQETTDNKS